MCNSVLFDVKYHQDAFVEQNKNTNENLQKTEKFTKKYENPTLVSRSTQIEKTFNATAANTITFCKMTDEEHEKRKKSMKNGEKSQPTPADNTCEDAQENTQERCSLTKCFDDGDQYHLRCKTCKQKVHYRCTQLPYYELERYLSSSNRVHKCRNCSQVSDSLREIMSQYPRESLTRCKEVEELAIIMQGMNIDAEKNGNWKKELVKDKENVLKLEKEVEAFKALIKQHQDNERELQTQVNILKQEIDGHTEHVKFNPDYPLIKTLEASPRIF